MACQRPKGPINSILLYGVLSSPPRYDHGGLDRIVGQQSSDPPPLEGQLGRGSFPPQDRSRCWPSFHASIATNASLVRPRTSTSATSWATWCSSSATWFAPNAWTT